MRRLAPEISLLPRDKSGAGAGDAVLTDQFFLNLAMAYCKAAMDAGAEIEQGTIVTVMTRNGKNFGIKISGMGDRWFTAPVNTPEGLFFSGFSRRRQRTSATARSPKPSALAARRWWRHRA